jgi:hypothetical protein
MAINIIVKRTGKALLPVRRGDEEALLKMADGVPYRAKLSKHRSVKGNNFYFRAIARACENWPHGQEPEPEGDSELLRAWLQCRAGPEWRMSQDFPVEAAAAVMWLLEHIRADNKYAFIKTVTTEEGPKLRVLIPKSTAFDQMDEEENAPLRKAVFEIIESVIGVKVEDLVYEAESAA